MKDYLSGYLSIIPANQRKKIVDVLLSNENLALSMNEEDYKELAQKLSQERDKLTTFKAVTGDVDKVSSDQFNTFHSQVYSDLYLLFNESDLVEEAIINYEHLHSAELNALQREIDALTLRIESLQLAAQNRSMVITKTEDFSRTSTMETSSSLSHLYRDRDGTQLPLAELQTSGSKSMLVSKTISNVDRLRENGQLIASIKIADWRGQPVSQVQHPIENALDSSFITFWGEVVLADDQVNIALDDSATGDMDGNTIIPAGGAICKFTVTLPKPVVINEITLTPFTVYPLQIACIKYERDPDSHEAPKYIVNFTNPVQSEDSIVLRFESVMAKKLTFYIKQANPTTNVYTVTTGQKNSADLWEKITAEETDRTFTSLTTSSTNSTIDQEKLDQMSGWSNYLSALETYKTQVQSYIDSINQYNKTYNTSVSYDLPDWVLKLPGLDFGGGK